MTGSDRALRRLVAQLPLLAPADFDAIVEGLSEDRRARVLGLLAELHGSAASGPLPRPSADALPPGLSPWLRERLGVPPGDGANLPRAAVMTSHALAALSLCATELGTRPPATARPDSLLSALWKRLRMALERKGWPA